MTFSIWPFTAMFWAITAGIYAYIAGEKKWLILPILGAISSLIGGVSQFFN